MMTAALLGHVGAYAAQVRSHLADLTPEQVDDLTDGLEADLAEALADPDARPATGETPTVVVGPEDREGSTILDLVARFGPPDAYADELRSAAGMPSPDAPAGPVLAPTRGEVLLAWWQEKQQVATSHPRWPAVRAFALALRPAWWVARGWVLFGILFTASSHDGAVVAPSDLVEWVVLLGFVWLSVEYGRGRWDLPRPLRTVAVGASVLAAVFLVPGIASAAGSGSGDAFVQWSVEPVADGVYIDGRPVTNLFVYDAEGDAIDRAQILDNRGRPVVISSSDGVYLEGEATTLFWVPSLDVDGRQVPNAYPLPTLREADAWPLSEVDDARERATIPPPPVRMLAPLASSPAGAADAEPDAPGGTAEGDADEGEDSAATAGDGTQPSDTPAGPDAPAAPADPSAPASSAGQSAPAPADGS